MSDPQAPGDIERFDLNERIVHWTSAILLISLIVTGTILYIPSFMLAVGHRATVVNIHVITGLGLLAPVLIGLAGPWRKGLSEDVRRFDRWQRGDFDYFRPSRLPAPPGKFNGGQKLAAAVLAGGSIVMVMTGIVMRWSPPFPNSWASGATFVHDSIYLVLSLVVIGHILVASSRPLQLRSMFTGRIPREWAERYAPAWLNGSDLGGGATSRARTRPRPSAGRDEVAGAGTTRASG